MNWIKKQAANIAGTAEPIYGPSAIQTVGARSPSVGHTVATRQNFQWQAKDHTCVETQVWYVFSEEGHIAMAQIIWNNIGGMRTTAQFNSKIFYAGKEKPHLWASDPLDHVKFDATKTNFSAENLSVNLNEQGTEYVISSKTNKQSVVNFKITQTAPGFVAGSDGKTTYGKDPAHPWGGMYHAFWPRAKCEGGIMTKEGEVKFNGPAVFIHALQDMKPHHAASRWNFMNFQSPNISAVMMEFTTPPSYGSTVVNVSGLAKDGELLCAGTTGSATHTDSTKDTQNDWPEPKAIKMVWSGKTSDGKDISAVLEGPLDDKLDKVDVMAEVPGFVKSIVSAAAGTKPYIYQYRSTTLKLKLTIDGQTTEEEGKIFSEATFIS